MIALQLLPLLLILAVYVLYAALWWKRRQRGYMLELHPDSETPIAVVDGTGSRRPAVLQPGERLHVVPDHPTPTPPADPVSTAAAKKLEQELFGDLESPESQPDPFGDLDTEPGKVDGE